MYGHLLPVSEEPFFYRSPPAEREFFLPAVAKGFLIEGCLYITGSLPVAVHKLPEANVVVIGHHITKL